jgi:two-component system KDP operon response regulator KdpE
VLIARIKAHLKRSSGTSVQATELTFQHITIHLATRQVTADDQLVYLTETEYNLLLELAKNHDRVLTHEYLLNAVWGNAYKDEVNYLRSYVHNLRRKLERDPANPQLILSRMGVGYMLVSTAPAMEEVDFMLPGTTVNLLKWHKSNLIG